MPLKIILMVKSLNMMLIEGEDNLVFTDYERRRFLRHSDKRHKVPKNKCKKPIQNVELIINPRH